MRTARVVAARAWHVSCCTAGWTPHAFPRAGFSPAQHPALSSCLEGLLPCFLQAGPTVCNDARQIPLPERVPHITGENLQRVRAPKAALVDGPEERWPGDLA